MRRRRDGNQEGPGDNRRSDRKLEASCTKPGTDICSLSLSFPKKLSFNKKLLIFLRERNIDLFLH